MKSELLDGLFEVDDKINVRKIMHAYYSLSALKKGEEFMEEFILALLNRSPTYQRYFPTKKAFVNSLVDEIFDFTKKDYINPIDHEQTH